MCRITLVTFICSLMLFVPHSVRAEMLFVNVIPNPESPNPESFELLNNGSSAIDLSGWEVWDSVSTPSLLFTLEAITLEPQAMLHLELSSAKLNNAGDTLRLFSNSGEEITVLSYENAQINQFFPSESSQETTYPASPSPVPTPPSPTPFSDPTTETSSESDDFTTTKIFQLSFIQILSCPEDSESESVVLNNDSDRLQSGKVQLVDAAGNSLEFEVSLAAGESTLLPLSRSIINNSGDTLYLQTESSLLDTAQVPACVTTSPFIRSSSGVWVQEVLSTPPPITEITKLKHSLTELQPSASPSPSGTFSPVTQENEPMYQNTSKPWDVLQPLLQYERSTPSASTRTLTRRINRSSYYLGGIIGGLSIIMAALRLAPFTTHAKDKNDTERLASSHSLGSDDLFTLTPGDTTRIKR